MEGHNSKKAGGGGGVQPQRSLHGEPRWRELPLAMGEGLDGDGHHVHNFLPEDRVNFNASHVVHGLSFMDAKYNNNTIGDGLKKEVKRSLNGVSNYATKYFLLQPQLHVVIGP